MPSARPAEQISNPGGGGALASGGRIQGQSWTGGASRPGFSPTHPAEFAPHSGGAGSWTNPVGGHSGFSRPIHASPAQQFGGVDHRTFVSHDSFSHDSWHGGHDGHSGSAFFVGFGTAGFGISAGFAVGHSGFVSFSFGTGFCGSCWHSGCGHCGWGWPYWHCNPWGGFCYVPIWPCYPWWWYPGYSCSVYPCGPWYRVAYCPPTYPWLADFSFCNTPCEATSDCGLVTTVASCPPPGYLYSPYNAYKYSYIASENPPAAAPVIQETLPAPATAAELAGTTQRELGDTYMKLGDAASATRVYGEHVQHHPGDVQAVRNLGFALIESGEVQQGTEQVERAYRIDPALAANSFDRQLLRDPVEFQASLDRVTTFAAQSQGRPEAGAAWLTVSVLMQADGRIEPARSALEKAKEAGLNDKVVESMRAQMPYPEKPS
jgi:hypothetical protein